MNAIRRTTCSDLQADRLSAQRRARDSRHSRFAETLNNAVQEKAQLQRVEIEEAGGTTYGLTTVPLVDEQGKHLGMFALFTDLGPIRRLQSAYGIAVAGGSRRDFGRHRHEFRNSLSTILGYLRLAEANESICRSDGETSARGARGDRPVRCGGAPSEFARPFTLQLVAVDLKALIVQIGERLASTADGAVIDIEGEDAVLQGDPALLERAFRHLIPTTRSTPTESP